MAYLHTYLKDTMILSTRVLQYIGIFSSFQYLMHSHTGINNYDTGIPVYLKS